MATKWQIQFQSLKGVPYTCNILESGYTGSIIRVQGAPDPFTVQEDNTEEYFHPVRTQTGYLRIIDTQTDMSGQPFDWSEMIPANNTAHQVQLLRNGELVWIGYMKAALFTTQAFDYGNVVEFPLICPLALLDSVQLSFTNSEGSLLTMGQILYHALQATGIAWEFVDVANNVENLEDLNARVSMMNFTDVDPSVNTVTEVATWTDDKAWSSVLDSICALWGWTIYSRGKNVYITCYGDATSYRRFAFSQLADVIPTEMNIYTGADFNMETLEYRSTDHYEDYILGRRTISIESQVGTWDNIIAPQFKELQYEWWGGEGHVVQYGDYRSIQFFLRNTTTHYETLHNYRLFINPIYLGTMANVVLSEDDSWQKDEVKDSFSLRNNIQVIPGGTQPSDLLQQRILSIRTFFAIAAPLGSMLSISAVARGSLDPSVSVDFDPDSDYVRMMLRIGDKYWNQASQQWTTSPAVFNAYIDGSRIATTKGLFDPHNGATGFCIPLNESVYGEVELSILMSPPRGVILDALTVKVVPTDNMVFPTAESERTYTGVANTTFADDESVSLDLMCGDNNKYGKGQVFTSDGQYLGNLSFQGEHAGTMLPEQHLLQRMTDAYAQIRHRMTIVVAEDQEKALPTSRFARLSGETADYHVQSVSHNYADDTMTLTLIEL